MAKKKRRVKQQKQQEAAMAAAQSSSSNSRDVESRLRSEYAYVIKDLRIIFAVAAAMFVLLIVLNLLI